MNNPAHTFLDPAKSQRRDWDKNPPISDGDVMLWEKEIGVPKGLRFQDMENMSEDEQKMASASRRNWDQQYEQKKSQQPIGSSKELDSWVNNLNKPSGYGGSGQKGQDWFTESLSKLPPDERKNYLDKFAATIEKSPPGSQGHMFKQTYANQENVADHLNKIASAYPGATPDIPKISEQKPGKPTKDPMEDMMKSIMNDPLGMKNNKDPNATAANAAGSVYFVDDSGRVRSNFNK
jgi:hypothetical protein